MWTVWVIVLGPVVLEKLLCLVVVIFAWNRCLFKADNFLKEFDIFGSGLKISHAVQ